MVCRSFFRPQQIKSYSLCRSARPGMNVARIGLHSESVEQGRAVTKVEDYDSSEILGGCVKTLHPAIHEGILAREELGSH